MKVLMIAVLLVFSFTTLGGPAYAQTMERDVEMSFDGKVEYVSEHGSGVGQTVLAMDGEGKADVSVSNASGETSMSHSTAGESEGLSVIEGAKFADGSMYLTKMEGEAKWEHSYKADVDPDVAGLSRSIEIVTESETMGRMQRIIEMENTYSFVSERFSVKGYAWVLDMINFIPAVELEE